MPLMPVRQLRHDTRALRALPAPATMYRALTRHDPAYEGVFWLGVRTTGIFCRPTCRARTPHRENVEFFASTSDALHAGYRPCLKCRPLDHGRAPPPLVARLLAAVERAPSRRFRDSELADLGIDPSTARRQFKRYCGMTFQAYHRARRMGLALLDIRKGKTVLDSQLDQGFESASGFRDAFNRLVGTAPSRAGDLAVLHARWIETPLGPMLAVADDRGLHLLDFVDRRGLERALAMLQRRLKARVLPGAHRHLDGIEAELAEYFAGARTTFATPIVLTGSEFQQRVWRELLTIPAGETRSYAALAVRIGAPKAVRAVGRANGDNRLSIIVPCHRVIGSDGALQGYGGGLARKQKLLDLEQVRRTG
ncbi:MAG: bifunctional transcriptional activator/DNA repair protein Ada [Burkholderiales bacterium]|nr:bifunctional transcriptional activator/DNA repair protein Ada [Burkholderiales bacterium]